VCWSSILRLVEIARSDSGWSKTQSINRKANCPSHDLVIRCRNVGGTYLIISLHRWPDHERWIYSWPHSIQEARIQNQQTWSGEYLEILRRDMNEAFLQISQSDLPWKLWSSEIQINVDPIKMESCWPWGFGSIFPGAAFGRKRDLFGAQYILLGRIFSRKTLPCRWENLQGSFAITVDTPLKTGQQNNRSMCTWCCSYS